MVRFRCLCGLIFGALTGLGAFRVQAQASLVVYSNNLANGFQSWSYGATLDFSNAAPVHSTASSIRVIYTNTYGALALVHPTPFSSTPYANLSFWVYNGTNGPHKFQVQGRLGSGTQAAYVLPTLAMNTWQQFTIPLSTLGVANKSDFMGIYLESQDIGVTLFVDDIALGSVPAPVISHLQVDAAAAARTADARWFGMNTGASDGVLDTTTTTNELKHMGCLTLRWPGGSSSDDYHWASDAASSAHFYHVITNLGIQAVVTVNYGTGTSNEAAAWVLSANVTNHIGIKCWEVGNECFGSWETDSHSPAHDPYTYAVQAANYIRAMKQADSTIKIGVVACAGEDDYANNTSHPATNPRTGKVHNGWTPVMLTTLKSLGVTPDSLIYHYYPQGTGAESDPILMQSTSNWMSDAAGLRQQLTDYLGATGTNVELLCTENNSESGTSGKQECSLVTGLYLADTLAQLMQTEFNSYIWCGLQFYGRGLPGGGGNFDPSLYGWRMYGTQGVMSETACPSYPAFLTNCYPPYHAFSLMQYFVSPGDTVLKATSDYLLLSAYAARRTNGALTLLVVNKDATCTFNTQIALTNFVPWGTAAVYSYGIPQDEAARTNATPSAQGVAGPVNYPSANAVFTNSFPPYSLTLFSFAPAAARLTPVTAGDGHFVFQLQGQPSAPYVIQTSTNLLAWTSVSTNTLTGNTLNITNSIVPDLSPRFWRAVWRP